jgi:intracellular septation protein
VTIANNRVSDTPKPNALIKLALELGPLAVFFTLNYIYDIITATAWFMGAIVVSLIASRVLMGKLPIMPLVSGILVLIFGGLTVTLNDDLFIKLKPTIINVLFGSTLLVAQLLFRKSLLRIVMEDVMSLKDDGWRILSIRWGLFFFVLAALNEIVWRNFHTDVWVNFKVLGMMPLTMIFALCQIPVMNKYSLEKGAGDKNS